ncbi:hypothetical protein EH223_19340 [candidate division KSB1 bacterium]|nr:phage tail sheath subtilisin-like domain-containing protein [candidate division KSB1 bacterium]RQW00103.1 MAG: hypothetical protein EH223_19340 [candidate division KSB1 bacterium]
MAEMIVPGTYITVRAEGLISAGRIAAGIVGVVGTAASGPVGTPVTLAGFSNAREIFGVPDDYNRPEDGSHPLTLVRALEFIYNNGASTVLAVRVAGASKSSATFALLDSSDHTVATLTAKTPGTWGNNIHIDVAAAEDHCRINDETHTESFDALKYRRIVPTLENRIRIFRGTTKRIQTMDILYKRVIENEEVVPNTDERFFLASIRPDYPVAKETAIDLVQIVNDAEEVIREYGDGDILYDPTDPLGAGEIGINTTTGEITFEASEKPVTGETVIATYAVGYTKTLEPGQVLVTVWNGDLAYASGEAPAQANGDKLVVSYLVDKDNCVQVSLTFGVIIEQYITPDGNILSQLINQASTLETCEADETYGGNLPKTDVDAYFGTGSNTPGSNGAEAGPDEYAIGLESLDNKLVNIVVLAGQDSQSMGSTLLGHLNSTEQTDHERMGVLGAPGGTLANFLGHTMADDRVVLVAPPIQYPDGRTLPTGYTAAAVAGLISSLQVQTSLTNKTLNVPGLSLDFNRGQQEQLIKRNVLSIIQKNGFRVLKGMTTEGEGAPFSAVPTRRIVDYAKYGVRSAANPYLGRLNNVRVRAALKATLDAFLTRMVEDESLTGYELEVSATRAQEIAGEVSVAMTLQPTFSIEYIKVTMILK